MLLKDPTVALPSFGRRTSGQPQAMAPSPLAARRIYAAEEDDGRAMPEPMRAIAAAPAAQQSAIRWGWVVAIIFLSCAIWPLAVAASAGLIPACIAHKRGRSFIGWWIYGSAIFIVALPHILMSDDGHKKQCGACKEHIHIDATVCPHCRQAAAI